VHARDRAWAALGLLVPIGCGDRPTPEYLPARGTTTLTAAAPERPVPDTNRCQLYFDNDQFTLDDAARALGERKLSVTARGDTLDVRRGGGPVLHVRLARGPAVWDDARRIGAGTKYADRLARCGSRLVITFADLDAVLDEINTLIDVQSALEKATGGLYYNCWNRRFSDD
jgi:hypothetical protein